MFNYQGSLFVSFFSSDSFYILSKAFVFVKNFFIFLFALFELSFTVSRDSLFMISLSELFVNNFFDLFLNLPVSFRSRMSRLRVFFYLPFLCCFYCCSSATNVILSQLFLIVNVFYIFHAIQTILTIYVE